MLHLQPLHDSFRSVEIGPKLTQSRPYKYVDEIKLGRLSQDEDLSMTETDDEEHDDDPNTSRTNWVKLEAERSAALSKRGEHGICKACTMLLDRKPYCHYNWSYLCMSAKAGCRSCLLLELSVRDHVRGRWARANFDPYSVLDISFSADQRLVFVKVSGRTYNFELFQDPLLSDQVKSDEPGWYRFARKWLDECLSSHATCSSLVVHKGHMKTGIPTRLLSIGGEKIRLVDSSGLERKTPRYAIMSYCWGGKHDAVTTKSNLSKRMRDIDIFTLPKTLQDGIKVARKMGFDYLWIDALCIVQNSQDEWNQECSRMVDYYISADLTISALDNASVNQGFLKKRDLGMTTVQLSQNDGVMIRPKALAWWEIFQSAPANKRGWTLQERLLSRRVLHFTDQEVIWECLTCSKREASAETHEAASASIGHSTESPDFKRSVWVLGDDPLSTDNGAYSLWYRVVTHYTKRQLSHQTDKLPAVAGIATFLSGLLTDKLGTAAGAYSLGIWLADPHSLLWASSLTWQDLGAVSRLESAPSWSWASMGNAVFYRFYDEKRVVSHKDAIIIGTGSLQDASPPLSPALDPSQGDLSSLELSNQSNRLDRFLRTLHLLPSESNFLNVRRSSTSSSSSSSSSGGMSIDGEQLTYLDINAQHTSLVLEFSMSAIYGSFEIDRRNSSFITIVRDATKLEPCGLVALDQGPDSSPLRELRKPVDNIPSDASELQQGDTCIQLQVTCTALRIGDRVYDSPRHKNSVATYFLLVVKDSKNEGCWRRIGVGLTRIWGEREWTTYPHVFESCKRANFRLV